MGIKGLKNWVPREGGEGDTPCVSILLLRDHGKGRERPGTVRPRKGGEAREEEVEEEDREESGEGEGRREGKAGEGDKEIKGRGAKEGRERREEERRSTNKEKGKWEERKKELEPHSTPGHWEPKWAPGLPWRGAPQAGPGSEESTVGRYEDLLGPAVPLSSEGIKNKLLRAST